MTEPRRAVLALDQGSHASRACVVDQTHAILAQVQIPIRTLHGATGQIEHDAEELAASLQTAARAAVAAARDRDAGLSIEAAGLATQRSTIVCFNRRCGTALSPAISWQDRRNAGWLASFTAQSARIRALTGLPLSPHYGVGKMRWCLEHLPAVQAACRLGELQIAPVAAFLAARLTGQTARVDPANASRTLLWDRSRHNWSGELLELFGIDRCLLPVCTLTRADYGRLRLAGDQPLLPGDSAAAIAADTAADGRAADAIALRAVTGDQSAVPFAFGAPDTRAIYINLGTGAFIQRPVLEHPVDPWPLLASVLALEEHAAWYCLEGTVNGAGSATGAFLSQAQLDETSLWPQLERLPANPRLPIYINGIGGLGSPYWRPAQPSYFIGDGTSVERFAAVLESIVFLIAINFEYMRRWGGEPERVLISGGLSRSDWLCLRLAASLGVPVLRIAQEATVLGVAVLAAPKLFGHAPAPLVLSRFEPRQLSTADLAGLTARRARFEACLREPH